MSVNLSRLKILRPTSSVLNYLFYLTVLTIFNFVPIILSTNSEGKTEDVQEPGNFSNLPTPKTGAGKFAGSLRHLQFLAEQDESIYLAMQDLGQELKRKVEIGPENEGAVKSLRLVKKYLRDFEESTGQFPCAYKVEPNRSHERHEKCAYRSGQVSFSPLASFRLIRRMTFDLPLILNLLQSSLNSQILKSITSFMRTDLGWPSEDSDLKAAMDSIIRIQVVYNLTAEDLAAGVISGNETKVELTSQDCFRLGQFIVENECCYEMALAWFLAARNKLQNQKNPTVEFLEEENQRDFSKSLDEQILMARSEMLKVENLVQSSNEAVKTHLNGTRERFYALCNGENLLTLQEEKELFCWYEKRRGLLLSPVKSELLSRNPPIIQYYDLIGNEMIIASLKSEASPSLARSRVFAGDSDNETNTSDDDEDIAGQIATYRTSLSTFIPEGQSDRFRKLPGLIERVTGLVVTTPGSAESLQIASYAFGGHYQLHYDEVEEPSEFVGGGRIATFMFYLTDVIAGGFTAFPLARVAAKPVKGSAVFWFNLLSDGRLDNRMEHGACPTIQGEKWVANKWILYNSQWTHRKCQLKPHTRIELELKYE